MDMPYDECRQRVKIRILVGDVGDLVAQPILNIVFVHLIVRMECAGNDDL